MEKHCTPAFLQAAMHSGLMGACTAVFIESGPDRASLLGVPNGLAAWTAQILVPTITARGLPVASAEPTMQRAEAPPAHVPVDGEHVFVTGSSFGGLSALFTAVLAPAVTAVAQSPSLWRLPQADFAGEFARARERSGRTPRVRLSAGQNEGHMLPAAQSLRAALAAVHVDAGKVHAAPGGHDWAWWQPDLIDHLARLLAPGDSPQ